MRLIARFAKDRGSHFELITVYDKKTDSETIDKSNPIAKSIAKRFPTAIWFERKIYDDFGLKMEDSFDKRPLLHHERFPHDIHPMCKNFTQKRLELEEFVPYKYERIDGDGTFEVAVGPIHAGIIEPGHFQFSQAGEDMLHLEVRHFYTYRGIEKSLEGLSLEEAKPIVERISGNESVAYQIALFDIHMQALHKEVPLSVQKYNALLLELERVIHHLTDLGFIPNDAGFAPALAICSKLSEDARRWMKKLTNSRFGFGSITFDETTIEMDSFLLYLDELQKEIDWFEDWIIDVPSLWDRFDTTGRLSIRKTIKYGTVGVVARASGRVLDRRLNHFYIDHGFVMAGANSGDVSARFLVRIDEIKNSILMMKNFIDNKKEEIKSDKLYDGEYNSYVESSLGEVFMHIELKDKKIERFFVRDPSFINWQALHVMMDGDIIADFPLINKSCDLSYAGSDL